MRKSTVALLTVAAMACATQVFAQSVHRQIDRSKSQTDI